MNTVTSINNTPYQNNYNKVDKKEQVSNDEIWYNRELGEVSFEIKRDEDLDPYSVSYEDYKSLNINALETIFGKNTPEFDSAIGLMGKTNITDDDILNKVFFDKTLNQITHGGDYSMMSSLAMVMAIPLDIEAGLERMFDPDNIGMFNLSQGQLEHPFWQKILSKGKDGIIPSSPDYSDNIDLHNSKQLLEHFRNIEEFFHKEVNVDGYKHYFDEEKMFEVVDDIVKSYDNQVKENNAILEQLTKNNKPNPIDNLIQEDDG